MPQIDVSFMIYTSTMVEENFGILIYINFTYYSFTIRVGTFPIFGKINWVNICAISGGG